MGGNQNPYEQYIQNFASSKDGGYGGAAAGGYPPTPQGYQGQGGYPPKNNYPPQGAGSGGGGGYGSNQSYGNDNNSYGKYNLNPDLTTRTVVCKVNCFFFLF